MRRKKRRRRKEDFGLGLVLVGVFAVSQSQRRLTERARETLGVRVRFPSTAT
ncbi:hypothetical protein ACLOJK_024404 [Asimina triloba]